MYIAPPRLFAVEEMNFASVSVIFDECASIDPPDAAVEEDVKSVA